MPAQPMPHSLADARKQRIKAEQLISVHGYYGPFNKKDRWYFMPASATHVNRSYVTSWDMATGETTCSCPAGKRRVFCYHVLALQILVRSEQGKQAAAAAFNTILIQE
jgi:hypothetical protein